MDLAVLLGIVMGAAALLAAHFLGGGTIQGLISPVGLIVIFGGTLSATTASVGFDRVKEIPGNILLALRREGANPYEFVDQAVGWFEILHKQGRTHLEQEARRQGDGICRYALQAVADGREEHEIIQAMQNMMRREQFAAGISSAVFETAGGYAPTFGIMATVLGLIQVLGHLNNPSQLGPSIATAFLGTFYGIASANIFWLPIAKRLGMKAQERADRQHLHTDAIRLLLTASGPSEMRARLWISVDPQRASEEADAAPAGKVGASQQPAETT